MANEILGAESKRAIRNRECLAIALRWHKFCKNKVPPRAKITEDAAWTMVEHNGRNFIIIVEEVR